MNSILQTKTFRSVPAVLLGAFLFSAGAFAADANVKVSLHGSEEVPPVTTAALGSGTIKIADDKSVSGSIMTKGIEGTVAHIHLAEKGKNGPPIITLTKTGDNEWSVPAGSKLTDAQYVSFKAGDLYVNVHSAANKSGEIRAQLKP
jgi:hypothetical protein